MEDESVTNSDSTTSIHTKRTTTMTTTMKIKLPPENLYRVGSGTSVILDTENGIEAESRKLPSSRFKGVVPQPNGRWGAQIYEKHQRVWLGTFNEEESAAKAYDIAALRFRGRDAVTNFKSSPATFPDDNVESAFLNAHSKLEIVDMLRKHTYKDELEQSKKQCNNGVNFDINRNRVQFGEKIQFTSSDRVFLKAREQLFVKTVTPSDVGKLNRLVIPKQHAEKHFPLQNGNGNNGTSKGVLLNFEDTGRKVWRFRYSYWNSSQSYVLTKGWSRFVKEKNLKAGDIVSFQRSIGPDNKQLYIDWKVRDDNGSGLFVGLVDNRSQMAKPVQMVRLFGVNILNVPVCSVVDSSISSTNSAKRSRATEFLSLDYSKKQRVIGAL